jgi:hypothetical protein
MALKGTKKSTGSKVATCVGIFAGMIGIGGVANMFWQLLARETGFENALAYTIGEWTLYAIAAVAGAAIIYFVWPDATPEQVAAKRASVKRAAVGPVLPNFDAAVARDKAARDAFMAEDDSDYTVKIGADDDEYEKVGEMFNSDLARDMRARR